MKNNVINPQFSSIQFGKDGSIEIIGITGERQDEKGSVLIIAKSAELDWLQNWNTMITEVGTQQADGCDQIGRAHV